MSEESFLDILQTGEALPSLSGFLEDEVDLILTYSEKDLPKLKKFVKKNPDFYYYQGYEGVCVLLFKNKPNVLKIEEVDMFHRGGMGKVTLPDGRILIIGMDLD